MTVNSVTTHRIVSKNLPLPFTGSVGEVFGNSLMTLICRTYLFTELVSKNLPLPFTGIVREFYGNSSLW